MSILENAKKHFADKINGELQKITVHEWKTDVYYKTAHSFAIESKILGLQQQGKIVEALVESIILKALTIDGNKMFTQHDKLALMNEVDPGVLTRIAAAINQSTLDIRQEDTVKN